MISDFVTQRRKKWFPSTKIQIPISLAVGLAAYGLYGATWQPPCEGSWAESGGAGRAEQTSRRYRKKQPWMVSDLLLAIREVDEVIHLQEQIVVYGTMHVWGSIPCDPIRTETPAHLGSNAFRAANQIMVCTLRIGPLFQAAVSAATTAALISHDILRVTGAEIWCSALETHS